jgi:integrase/recombinase XerD
MIDPSVVEDMLNSCNSPKTREIYSNCLKWFLKWYNDNQRTELNQSTINAYRSTLTKSGISSSYINLQIAAIKRLAYYKHQDDLMATWAVERYVKYVPSHAVKTKKAITLEQIKAILTSCQDGTVKGIRDEAIIALMFGAGLRRSEVINLNLADFDQMDIYVRQSKGGKSRQIPLPEWAIRRLNAWLDVRPTITGEKALFVVWSRGRISGRNLYAVFSARASQAGMKGLHPHNARSTYVTQLLKLKNDIGIVGRLVGHASVNTTLIYDLRTDEELRVAVNSFKLD